MARVSKDEVLSPLEPRLTVPQIAEALQVKRHTVLGWIATGALRAIDVSRSKGGRHNWRVKPSDLEEFERARLYSPPQKKRRRKSKASATIKFF